jgi:hypothetical protein
LPRYSLVNWRRLWEIATLDFVIRAGSIIIINNKKIRSSRIIYFITGNLYLEDMGMTCCILRYGKSTCDIEYVLVKAILLGSTRVVLSPAKQS